MLYYTGNVDYLIKKGFLQNKDCSYWYLPTDCKTKSYNCLVILPNGLIEYEYKNLDVLKGQYKKA